MNDNIVTKPYIGGKIISGFIDYFLIYGFTFILIFSFGELNADDEYQLKGWPSLMPILFGGMMTVGCEQIYGATIGNSIVMLKSEKHQRLGDLFANTIVIKIEPNN